MHVSLMFRLSVQVCDHPFLVADFEQAGSGASDPLSASGKLVVLDKLLRHLHTNNHKVLLLSHYPKVDQLKCIGRLSLLKTVFFKACCTSGSVT